MLKTELDRVLGIGLPVLAVTALIQSFFEDLVLGAFELGAFELGAFGFGPNRGSA
jgi:hypothetical protein